VSGRRLLRENGLGLAFGGLFLLTLVGQGLAGHAQYAEQQIASGAEPVSLGHYLLSSSLAVDVVENWQSEYLQFFLYIFGTVWLVQRGSPESKELQDVGTESDEEQRIGEHARDDSPRWAAAGGWRTGLFSRSLGIAMGVIFLASWAAMSVAGWSSYNEQQLTGRQDPVGYGEYVLGADFWARTLQNWQSELLAVGSMAVLAVFLRQRGSPESKPVGAATSDTGETG
jgi:hypothetical protein